MSEVVFTEEPGQRCDICGETYYENSKDLNTEAQPMLICPECEGCVQ